MDDRLLASPRPARFQAEMYVITNLFDRVGIYTNFNKKAGIVFRIY